MNGVQDVKDTFYLALRDRIAAGNAGRTMVVRGVNRPAVMVAENELPGPAVALAVNDAFCVQWTTVEVDASGLVKLGCEIHYATEGQLSTGGMDRGRALAAMDAELGAALVAPAETADLDVQEAGGSSSLTATGTDVFWGEPGFGPVVIRSVRLERTTKLEVFGYE